MHSYIRTRVHRHAPAHSHTRGGKEQTEGRKDLLQILPKLATTFLLPSVGISRPSAHLFNPQHVLSLLITYHKVLSETCLQKNLILTFILVQITGSTSLGSALGSHFGKLLLFACYCKLIPNVCILFMNPKLKQALSLYLCVCLVSITS